MEMASRETPFGSVTLDYSGNGIYQINRRDYFGTVYHTDSARSQVYALVVLAHAVQEEENRMKRELQRVVRGGSYAF